MLLSNEILFVFLFSSVSHKADLVFEPVFRQVKKETVSMMPLDLNFVKARWIAVPMKFFTLPKLRWCPAWIFPGAMI